MARKLPVFFFVVCLFVTTYGQDAIRTYDGTNNNLLDPVLGSAGSTMKRIAPAMYKDGMSEPMSRMNPRQISNLMFAQDGLTQDQLGLSAYIWAFGQFIDHDITLVPNNEHEFMPILLPPNDLLGAIIPFERSAYDPTTGESAGVPREHVNVISAFVDGSGIYGSDQARADWLRTFEGGKLKVSQNDLLPFGTIDGEFNSSRDPLAPFMGDDTRSGVKLMVAGDVRANENLYLTALHTLFVREHNRLADELATKNPSWSDEDLYQHARRMVVGYLQNIVFNEWLPAMGIQLPEYQGYDPSINPAISNEFSAAAFRLGHTLVNSTIYRMDNSGNEIPQGNLQLRDAYFKPVELLTGGGIDPLFKGMATQIQNEFDCKVVDDVRNFLFGSPGQGGLDLAALNIFRGRERGIADYNSIRKSIGLEGIEEFSDITDNAEVVELLEQIYESVDNIDPWVGMLSESRMESSIFGPTVNRVIYQQFLELRDGDRFYFENDPGLSFDEKELIRSTLFSDIVKRNTEIDLMQDYVFEATPHQDIPNTPIIVAERHLDMVAYPSPFNDEIKIRAFGQNAGPVEIVLLDGVGREVEIYFYDLKKGVNDFRLSISQRLDPGLYAIQLRMDDRVSTRKLLKS